MQSLNQSFEYCRELTQRTAHNFRFSFLTLPAAKRRAMEALYAFNRITDDLGDDESVELELRRVQLTAWRESIRYLLRHESHAASSTPPEVDGYQPPPTLRIHRPEGAFSPKQTPRTGEIGTFSDHPAHMAIADVVHQYQIPPQYLFAVIDGVEQDLDPVSMAKFADLENYCYHVAGAVGLCCIHIWGFHRDPRAIPLAIDCGLALQLTNILRDLAEDADQGRFYLPHEDLVRFGYSQEDLRQRRNNQPFQELMRFQVERAKSYYARAEQLLPYLEPDGKPILRAMIDIYQAVLHEIEHRRFDVFSRRVSIPKWKKLWFATRAMIFSR